MDPLEIHFQTGIACPRAVDRKEDFFICVIGSYAITSRVFDIWASGCGHGLTRVFCRKCDADPKINFWKSSE